MPEITRLPVSTRDVIDRDGGVTRTLHVFCPALDATVTLERCSDCPLCSAFDAGEGPEARPSVLCGASYARGAGVLVGRVVAQHSVCLRADAPLEDLDTLAAFERMDVPVVDDGLALVGVITPQRSGAIKGQARRITPAIDIAVRAHAAVEEQSSVAVALTLMVAAHARRLPVVSGDGKVIGVVEDLDAMRARTSE